MSCLTKAFLKKLRAYPKLNENKMRSFDLPPEKEIEKRVLSLRS